MSAYNDLDLECEKCGEEFRGTVWSAVHAGQDPELKDLLLGGELNLIMCPACSHVAFHESFLIYQDPAEELIAYVYPESQSAGRAELEKLMRAGFHEAQESLPPDQRVAYEPFLVFGLESLVEMLQDERNLIDQSDVAEAVCREKGIPWRRLSPSESRARQWPRVLPVSPKAKGISTPELLEGLSRLLTEDPALDLYRDLEQRLQSEARPTDRQTR